MASVKVESPIDVTQERVAKILKFALEKSLALSHPLHKQ